MPSLQWKIGVEIELLAPPGKNRRDLAEVLAGRQNGKVQRFFHPQAEPSKVPGTPIFENLTLGFNAVDAQGNLIARCVDDLTLQDNLDKQRPSLPDWYRIVSDDGRLLRLIMRQTSAEQPLEQVMEPIAELFGVEPSHNAEGMIRVGDEYDAPIAIAAPLPGERERPCELITPPIESDHFRRIDELLSTAVELGFSKPLEGATHIHFDATPLCQPFILANLVRVLAKHRAALKKLVDTNPRCRRLGAWPKELEQVVQSTAFLMEHSWDSARKHLLPLKLNKYCDFNIRNFIIGLPDKQTFEVRILPVWLETQTIIEAAALFEAILNWSVNAGNELKPVPADLGALLDELPMQTTIKQRWQNRL